MWSKIFRRFSTNPSRKSFIADILSDESMRESVLQVRSLEMPTPEQISRDIDKVIRFSKSSEYSVWAKEAWSEVLKCMDKLTRNNLAGSEVDFCRGELSKALDLLRISYIAQFNKEDQVKNQKGNQ